LGLSFPLLGLLSDVGVVQNVATVTKARRKLIVQIPSSVIVSEKEL